MKKTFNKTKQKICILTSLMLLTGLLIVPSNLFSKIEIGYGVTLKNNTNKTISAYVESESKNIKRINIIAPWKEKFLPSVSGPREIRWTVFINDEVYLHYKTTKKYNFPHIITISGKYGEKYQLSEKNGELIKHEIENAIWQTDVLVTNATKKPVNITIGSNSKEIKPKDTGLIGVASQKPLPISWTIANQNYVTKNFYDLIKSITIENNGKEFTIEARNGHTDSVRLYHGNSFLIKQDKSSGIKNLNTDSGHGANSVQPSTQAEYAIEIKNKLKI
jgi:hypothetical protein